MDIINRLFGKKKSIQMKDKKSPNITINPFTVNVMLKDGELLFKCPTCPDTIDIVGKPFANPYKIVVNLQQIDPIIGINVVCSDCKNVFHVPGAYKTNPKPPGMRITGGIRVPITKFSDWYYENQLIVALIENGRSDLLNDYGLWAFCGACLHQFSATILNSLAPSMSMAQRGAGSFVFMANIPSSVTDWDALRAGHCSQCEHEDLIVIAAEIPDYVRNVIAMNK